MKKLLLTLGTAAVVAAPVAAVVACSNETQDKYKDINAKLKSIFNGVNRSAPAILAAAPGNNPEFKTAGDWNVEMKIVDGGYSFKQVAPRGTTVDYYSDNNDSLKTFNSFSKILRDNILLRQHEIKGDTYTFTKLTGPQILYRDASLNNVWTVLPFTVEGLNKEEATNSGKLSGYSKELSSAYKYLTTVLATLTIDQSKS